MTVRFLLILSIATMSLACGDDTVTEIENNDVQNLSPQEQARADATLFNEERRNDPNNGRCHMCNVVDDVCPQNLKDLNAAPCEWEAVNEDFQGSQIWSTRCNVVEQCVGDPFICESRCR